MDQSDKSSWSYVDTHCHCDLYPNPLELIRQINDKNIYTLAMTNTPSVFSMTTSMLPKNGTIRPAIGLHPQLSAERKSEMSIFKKEIESTKYVGEVGLDYSYEFRFTREIQLSVFKEILKLCSESGGKIISVHSRGAVKDIIEVIESVKNNNKIILHWFSGTKKQLFKAIDIGCYFSINMAMVNSQKGQEITTQIPRHRLLTESDGPFIQIDDHPASPLDITKIIKKLSELYRLNWEDLGQLVWNNFKKILQQQNNLKK